MSQNVGYIENQKYIANSGKQQPKRPEFVVVQKDTAVSHYAKLIGMSNEEFMKWANLKSSLIKKGTRIEFPMDTVPAGKGIYALARKYNMSVEEFCKLMNKTAEPKAMQKYALLLVVLKNKIIYSFIISSRKVLLTTSTLSSLIAEITGILKSLAIFTSYNPSSNFNFLSTTIGFKKC